MLSSLPGRVRGGRDRQGDPALRPRVSSAVHRPLASVPPVLPGLQGHAAARGRIPRGGTYVVRPPPLYLGRRPRDIDIAGEEGRHVRAFRGIGSCTEGGCEMPQFFSFGKGAVRRWAGFAVQDVEFLIARAGPSTHVRMRRVFNFSPSFFR